jgi:NifU-like protein involved in Fe-S cluster formation
MAYSEKVIERFDNPTHVGTLDKDDQNVGTGLVGAPACGDVLRLGIKVDPKTERIIEARWKGFGCGSLIASSQLACEMIEGRNLAEASKLNNGDIVRELDLPPV